MYKLSVFSIITNNQNINISIAVAKKEKSEMDKYSCLFHLYLILQSHECCGGGIIDGQCHDLKYQNPIKTSKGHQNWNYNLWAYGLLP